MLPVWGVIFGGAYFRNFTVIGARCKKGPQMLSRICADCNNKLQLLF